MDRTERREQTGRDAALHRQDRSVAVLSEAPQLQFDRLPALLPLYIRAILSRRPRAPHTATPIPTLSAAAAPFVPDRSRLVRYCELVGHRDSTWLPLTYPQVLAAPLQLALLTSGQSRLNPSGIVHVSNRIVVRNPLRSSDPLALSVALSSQHDTDRGRELVLTTSARDESGRPVWEAHATLLVRHARSRGVRRAGVANSPNGQVLDEITSFSVPANTGRAYARVSGDYNPIHLTAPTARLFGYRHAIAHGMWSLGRVLGELSDARSPQHVEVSFCRPLFLPAEVTLVTGRGDPLFFALRDRKSGKNLLSGAIGSYT